MADKRIREMAGGIITPAQADDMIPASRQIADGVFGDALLRAQDIAALGGDFQAPIVAGAAYTWPTQYGVSDNTGTNVLMTVPFWCSSTVTWTKIGISVVVGDPAARVRLGVYESNEFNRPGNLLVDAGEIDGSTEGFKELDISLTIQANTLVWLASLCGGFDQETSAFETLNAAPFADGREMAIIGATIDELSDTISFARAQAYGPLPTVCGPGDGDAGRYPLPYLRTGV